MKPEEFAAAGSVPKQTRDGFPVRMGPKAMPGEPDTYVAYGRGWANVSNTPFREYKHWVHEGGISTPLIAHWPKGITATGELRTQPGHLIDIAATCVDLAGAKYPQTVGDVAITPLEGKSLVGVFANKPLDRDLFWEHEGNRAIRSGNWKLVAKGPGAKWELYDIVADRTESADVSGRHPETVRDLAGRWEAWAKRAHDPPLDPGSRTTDPSRIDDARCGLFPLHRFHAEGYQQCAECKRPEPAHNDAEDGSPHAVLLRIPAHLADRQDAGKQGERRGNEQDGNESQVTRRDRPSGAADRQEHANARVLAKIGLSASAPYVWIVLLVVVIVALTSGHGHLRRPREIAWDRVLLYGPAAAAF